MIRDTVKSNNPKFDRLVMLLNLAANAYNDKDIEEEYRDIKISALADCKKRKIK